MIDPDFLEELQKVLGRDSVSIDPESRERNSFDAFSPKRLYDRQNLANCRVDAVARPKTAEQISSVMKLAQMYEIPVIPYGGGTGVMGAVIPLNGGISLDMRSMDRIIDIDASEQVAVVEPGVLLERLSSEAANYALILGHDPWSVPIATVGGAVSTDGVGYRAAKYGSMGKQVRALEIVLGDGQIIRTKPLTQLSSGPSMIGLFVGAEGTMGIITEITLQLFPKPEKRRFATFSFDSFEAGFIAVNRLYEIGLMPAVLDLTEEEVDQSGENTTRCILYLVFEGYKEEVNAQYKRTFAEVAEFQGTSLGPEMTKMYWNERHLPAINWKERIKGLRPTERWQRNDWKNVDYLHVALPIGRVLKYKAKAESIIADAGLILREAALWTHPSLFSLLIRDPNESSDVRQEIIAKTSETLLRLAVESGGGIEYCHGIGSKLIPMAHLEWADAMPLAQKLKKSLDPDQLLNPGKLALS